MKVIKEKYAQYNDYYNAYIEKIADAIEWALQEDKYSYSDFCYDHNSSRGVNKQLVDDYVKDAIREFNDGCEVLTSDEWNTLYDMADANDFLDKHRLEGGHDAFWNDFDSDVSDRVVDFIKGMNESLEEDTVKTSDGKWTNKGKEGTHGKFKTKKAADAQRKAMFANGYKGESLEEGTVIGGELLSYLPDGYWNRSYTPRKTKDYSHKWVGREIKDFEHPYYRYIIVDVDDDRYIDCISTNSLNSKDKIRWWDNNRLGIHDRGSVWDFTGNVVDVEKIIKFRQGVDESLKEKSMNEKLNKNQISAFKDIIGFNADVEEDLEEDFIDDTIADYDSIYGEVALEKLVEKIENDFKNEPFEESEDELTERLANEFAAKQYKRVYDCYCGQVKTRYGSLDERNLPIDEKLIDYASCKCNYDANVLKERLIQGMRDLNDQWLTEGRVTLPELRKEYGEELIEAIQNEFEDYRIYLEWYLKSLRADNVGADNKSYIDISIKGIGDDLYEISNDECGVLVKFITDVINQFIASHAYKIANRSVSLRDKSLKVVKPTEDSVLISFMLREDFNLSAFNGDSIDAVAEGIGRFEPASTTSIRCNGNGGSVWRTDLPSSEVMAKIAYQRQGGLSYGNGFKYWDRFKRITRVFPKHWSTNIRMAAEYIPNPDVILVWADFPVLMHRSDFEDAIRAASQEALQALKSN